MSGFPRVHGPCFGLPGPCWRARAPSALPGPVAKQSMFSFVVALCFLVRFSFSYVFLSFVVFLLFPSFELVVGVF